MKTAIDHNMTDGETRVVHAFEIAGFGKAPFALIGVNENVFRAGDHCKAGGTCDFCGTGIRWEYHIRSADGKQHKVGSECIRKADDAGLRRAVSATEAKRRRDAATAKRNAAVARCRERVAAMESALLARPHPNEFFASQGKTLLDYCRWNLDRGNNISALLNRI